MLAADLPSWARSEGPETTIDHLKNNRESIREHLEREISDWENIVITSVASEANERLVGMNMEDIAEELISDPAVAVMNLLIEEELEVERVYHFAAEEDVREILQYERAAVATDALLGGEPHPRTYGTYPRVLGHYARDENLFSVEEAVRMMTSLPARIAGLHNKGIISPGMDADLVAFDPHYVNDPGTYDNPRQFPDGMPHVVVNGEFIIRDGESTGAMPGTAIRK
jgi:N-acyl-D-amino-acid deacylase